LFLLLLATIVAAQLSSDCQYVDNNVYLTDTVKVKNCFNTYTVHPDVIQAILRNLEIIHDIYVYTDIAQSPPTELGGYFKKMNFTSGLEELKKTLAESGGVVSEVFRSTMAFINGFRDAHFSLTVQSTDIQKYNNIFAKVYMLLPFEWDVEVVGNRRRVTIHDPSAVFFSSTVHDKIQQLYNQGYYVERINCVDAFSYFENFFGDYRDMKSPQGSLVEAEMFSSSGFPLLQFPLIHAFDTQTMVFSDPSSTTISFKFGFKNNKNSGTRDTIVSTNPIAYISIEEEKKAIEVIKNFKKRTVRQPHEFVKCGSKPNFMQIDSFHYDIDQFLQELVECVALFDTNKDPITVILPRNGGGYSILVTASIYLLMPYSDFRTIDAMRKNDRSEILARSYLIEMISDKETCKTITTESEFNSFWERSVTDSFGKNVVHRRTDKAFEVYKEAITLLEPYQLERHVRKPTDIIVATDGFCFSSCALFVDNIIRSGGGIVAGYGVTNPDDELFGAGQCPSSVINPAEFFSELADNSDYGLSFRCTVVESYFISEKMDETIPFDFLVLPVDAHLKYYDTYNKNDKGDRNSLLDHASNLHKLFQTNCNPENKRLLFINDTCTVNKPFAVAGGYACGSNGEWDTSSCKVARCQEGYVVDFDNDKCVPNTCDPRYTPPPPPEEPASSPEPSSAVSFSLGFGPIVILVIALCLSFF